MRTGEVDEITLKGLTSTLSDYECADGDLQVCHNCANNGVGLQGIQEASVMREFDGLDHQLVFVHHTTTGDVYLTVDEDQSLGFYRGEDDEVLTIHALEGIFVEGQYQITSVGNALVVNMLSTPDGSGYDAGLHYFRWDEVATEYKYLGQMPPDIGLEFQLKYEGNKFLYSSAPITIKHMSDEYFEISDVNWSADDIIEELAESGDVANYVMAAINEVTSDCHKESKFLNPFFVRYAYRLYDGSYIMQSAPVLMIPEQGFNPTVLLKRRRDSHGDRKNWWITTTCYRACELLMKANVSKSDADTLKKWDDIISGIVICVSQEVPHYQSTGEKMRIKNAISDFDRTNMVLSLEPSPMEGGTFSCTILSNSGGFENSLSMRHGDWTEELDIISKWYLIENGFQNIDEENYWVVPPERDGTVKQWLNDAHIFYNVAEYSLEDIHMYDNGFVWLGENTWNKVKKEGSYGIENLTTFEEVPDGYRQRALKQPQYIHAYNSRVNCANMRLAEYSTIPCGSLSCYTARGEVYNDKHTCITKNEGKLDIGKSYIDIYIKEQGQIIKVTSPFYINDPTDYQGRGTIHSMPGFLFYPNTNAKYVKMHMVGEYNGTTETKDIWLKLEEHPHLSGAYYFEDDYYYTNQGAVSKTYAPDVDYSTWADDKFATSVNYYNQMWTSEVDNPFTFNAEGVSVIGTGKILTIKNASVALSEGTAYGAMPLYAFCTDGVYPLSVSENGLYSAVNQPTRETLINGNINAVMQTDNAVVFLSERGLMMLSGQSSELLSGGLQGRFSTFDVANLPQFDKIHGYEGATLPYLESDDFLSFINNADVRMAFDYANYRVIIYRPYNASDKGTEVAYVYNIATKTWSTMTNRLLSSVEGYPSSFINKYSVYDNGYAYISVGKYDIASESLIDDGKMFYVTRPIKMGKHDIMKTIRTLIERGIATSDDRVALWGSNDMRNWTLLTARNGKQIRNISGRAYKYYVAGGWSTMSINGGNISRLTIESQVKYIDKIR